MTEFFKKYKHGLIILIYCLVYLTCFSYLETRTVPAYNVVHTVFDDMIPFCEFFIVPYLLWFPYMIFAVVYFIFFNKNKHEYYQLIFNLMIGMTILLIVSYLYPNIQNFQGTMFLQMLYECFTLQILQQISFPAFMYLIPLPFICL